MLYVDWRCTVVAVEMACDSVGKLLAKIVADAPMGKAEMEMRRFVRRMGEGVERILRRVLCSCPGRTGNLAGNLAAQRPLHRLSRLAMLTFL